MDKLDDYPDAPHVVMGNNAIICKHCGTQLLLKLPILIDDFVEQGKAFAKIHQHCKLQTANGETERK